MPAAVASRARAPAKKFTGSRDSLPPAAKKTKLSQPTPPHQTGYSALLNGTANTKPIVAKTNGVKNSRKDKIDEATAVQSGGASGHGHGDVDLEDKEIISISSAESESDYSSSEDGDEDTGAIADDYDDDDVAPVVNGHMEVDGPVEDGTAEPEEQTFEERLQAHEPEPVPDRAPQVVDVESAFVGQDPESRALATATNNRPLSAPSATSLGTVLTQALRTNDKELLDSCLRVVDVDTIYATVERLPSPLVGNLLQKLAERLYKKPGRAGMLMVWVQWSLAAHGGFLASQPQLVKQLSSLNKVLKERASGLQPLLSLKGKLDMLQAQLELRRRNQRKAANDDEDEAVIYVEGEDDFSSAEEDDQAVFGSEGRLTSGRKRIRQDSDDEGASSVDQMPTTMEVDEDSDEGSEDSEDLLDDEAEETDNDTGDDMSEPTSDDELEEADEVSGSEEETKPARRSTVGRASLARRRF